MSIYFQSSLTKNLVEGIVKSPETMAFLKEQAKIIYYEQRELWRGQQTKEDALDREIWCEYQNEATKKFRERKPSECAQC